MKSFMMNFFLFMLPIFVFGVTLEVSLRNIPNDYSYKRGYLDQNSNQIEVLFLGSSHTYRGINPRFMSLRSFNASYVSQTLDYDYTILKQYENQWDSLKYIVVEISYFSLYKKLDTGIDAWRAKNYVIYYHIRSSNRIADQSELLSNKLAINFQRIYLYYFLKRSNISSSALGYGEYSRPVHDRGLDETARLAAVRHTVKLDDALTEKVFDENVNTLKYLFHFADERGIHVILYTPPGHPAYIKYLDKSQLSQTISTVTQLVRQYPNVIYVNYLNDPSFTEKDFWDGDHLNDAGAEKLTRKIDLLILSK